MGYPDYTAQNLQRDMAEISKWIDGDPRNQSMSGEAQLAMRTVVKIGEELGEVSAALIGMTGQNPRKGITHTADHVVKELLDVAATALMGVEHVNGNHGVAVTLLAEHIDAVHERMRQARFDALKEVMG